MYSCMVGSLQIFLVGLLFFPPFKFLSVLMPMTLGIEINKPVVLQVVLKFNICKFPIDILYVFITYIIFILIVW